MGLLDRLAKTVSDLKEQIDESGIIDRVKEVAAKTVDSSATGTSAAENADAAGAATSTGDERPDGWDAAVQRAGFNPMQLLTHAEVGAITGLEIHDSYPYFDDEWFGTIWQHDGAERDYYVEGRFIHGYTDGSPPDAPGMWEYLTIEAGITDQVDIGGGVDARRTGDSLYVNTGATVFHVYAGGLPEGSDRPSTSNQLAKAIIEKL